VAVEWGPQQQQSCLLLWSACSSCISVVGMLLLHPPSTGWLQASSR
jgi:hypothetical protein